MFPVLNVFGRNIGTYTLCIIIGLLLSTLLAIKSGKKYGFNLKEILYAVLAAVIGILLGGHLLYAVTRIEDIIALVGNITDMGFKEIIKSLASVFDGMVFYGGFIGAIITLKIYTVKFEKPKKSAMLDIYAVCVPLFHLFGRIGCFLGGCCYGIESKFGIGLNGVKRLPVSLIEVYFNLLLFLLLLQTFKKEKFKGHIIYIYMFFYSIIRFGTEFLRGDEDRGIWFGFSTSQWISAVLFFWAFMYFLTHLKSTFAQLKREPELQLRTDKDVFKVIVMSILTLGIYALVVMCRVSKDINKTASKYDGKRTMGYGLLFFLVGWLTLGIAHIVWNHKISARIGRELKRRNINYLFSAADFWLWGVLGIIVLIGPLVYIHKLCKTTNLLNADYNEKG